MPGIDRSKHIIQRNGKDFVLYEGLLAEAHHRWGNAWSMEVSLVQYDGVEAILTATVTTPDNAKFSDVGDANPDNVTRNVAPHKIRMGATRAKGRALRDALNISEATVDEVSSSEEDKPKEAPPKVTQAMVNEIVTLADKIYDEKGGNLTGSDWFLKNYKGLEQYSDLTKTSAENLIRTLKSRQEKEESNANEEG